MKLYLDDIRNIGDDWIIVRSYDEFVEFITNNDMPEIISFDHDLGLETINNVVVEKNGYDACKWLVEYCADNELKLPDWQIHSANPVGRKNINMYFINAKKHLNI